MDAAPNLRGTTADRVGSLGGIPIVYSERGCCRFAAGRVKLDSALKRINSRSAHGMQRWHDCTLGREQR